MRLSLVYFMSLSSDIVGFLFVILNGIEIMEIEDEEVEDIEEVIGFGCNLVCGFCLCFLYDIVLVIIINGC